MNTIEATKAVTHPYPGLRAFETDEAEIFFGREEHVDDLLARFQRRRFLGVIGPSGCGKSSLVRAGMIPALHAGLVASAGCGWQVAVMRPGTQPLKNLAHALWHSAGRAGEPVEEDDFLHTVLARGPLGLVDALSEYEFAGDNNLLLLVDQFEELFRITPGGEGSEARAFVDLLLASARTEQSRIYVILTLRSDFLGHCPVFRDLPEALNDSQYLTPRLNREQQRAAIEGPASLFNTTVRPELVTRILNEMGADPDQLPLMQHLLMRMWRKEGQKPGNDDQPLELTTNTYRLVGGLHGCVSGHTERVYGELNNDEQRVAELLFRRLAEVTSDARLVRRARRFGELCRQIAPQEGSAERAALRNVIEAFRLEGRTFLMPPQSEDITDDSLIDISHESVIRQWTRLRDWVLDEHKISRVSKIVVEKAARWKEKGEDKDYLLFGVELAEAKAWRDKYPAQLGEDEKRLLAESIKHEEDDVRKEEAFKFTERLKQKNRWLWTWLGAAVVCLILAMIFAWKATSNEKEAKDHAQTATAKELESKHSVANLVAERGLQLIEAGDLSGSQLWYTKALELDKEAHLSDELEKIHRIRLGAGMQQLPHLAQLLLHENLTSAVFSPDGSRIVTTSQDGSVLLWKATADQPITLTRRSGDWVNSAAFSPDPEGRFVVTGSGKPGGDRGEVRLFETATLEELWHFEFGGAVKYVAFSPDGRLVLAAGEADSGRKGEARILTAENGASFLQLPHESPVNQAAFSPGLGTYLVTASGQPGSKAGEAQVWNIGLKRRLPMPQLIFGEAVNRVEFSPDGRSVIAAVGDQGSEASQAQIVELQNTQSIERPLIHYGGVTWASFSPDGRYVLTASHDGTAKVWNERTRLALQTFKHGSSVYCATFSPDGRYVVTGSRDRSARVWEIATGEPATPPLNDTGTVSLAAFSPDGYRVLAASADTVRVWQLATGNKVPPVLKTAGWVHRVAWSANGSRVLTISGLRRGPDLEMLEAQVWDTVTGDERTHRLKLEGSFACAALSPDGDWVATAGAGPDGKSPEVLITKASKSGSNVSLHETGAVAYLVFNKMGDRLLTAGPGTDRKPWTLRLWDTKTGALLHTLEESELGEGEAVNCAEFSPDGRWVAAAAGKLTASTGKAQVWEVETGKKVTPLLMHKPGEGGVLHLAFSDDSRLLVTASADDSAKVWDIGRDGEPVGEPFAHTADVTFAAFGPDPDDENNKLLVTASRDQTVVVWDVKKGEKRATFRHDSYPNHAAFNSNGRLVVTASHDGTARLWDVASTNLVTILRHHGDVQFAGFDRPPDKLFTISYRAPTRSSEQVPTPATTPLESAVGTKALRSRAWLTSGTLVRQVQTQVWNIAQESHQIEYLRKFGQLMGARKLNEELNKEVRLLGIQDPTALSGYWTDIKQENSVLSPADAVKAHVRDGDECEATGQWFAAAWHLGELIKARPDTPVLLKRRADAFAHSGQWNDAYDTYSQALAAAPKEDSQRLTEAQRQECYEARDKVFAKLKPAERKVIESSKSLVSDPKNKEAHFERAKAYALLNYWEKAIQDYSEAIELGSKNWQVWQRRAEAYSALHEPEKVIDDCTRALELKMDDKDKSRILGQRAGANSALEKWEDARNDYTSAIDLDKKNGELWMSRAQIFVRLKHSEKAVDDLRQAALVYAGFQPPRWVEVIEAYSQALRLQSDAQLWRGRAEAYTHVYRWKEALEDYTEAHVLDPNDTILLQNRALTYSRLGKWEQAVADYTDALKLNPEEPELYRGRAQEYVNLLRWDSAAEDYTKALDLKLKDRHLRQSRGLVYSLAGRWEEAAKEFKSALNVPSEIYSLWQNLARAQANLGQWQNATESYDEMLKLQPKFSWLWTQKAQAQAEIHNWAAAAASLEKASELMRTQDRTVWRPLALVRLKEPNAGEYEKLCKDILKRFGQTDQADIANTVAWTCLLAPRPESDVKPLVKLAERAVEKVPNYYAYHNTLGVALYRAGHCDDAIKRLNQAREVYAGQAAAQTQRGTQAPPVPALPGDDGAALDGLFLAMAHHRLGQTGEAKQWLGKAVQAIEQYSKQKIKDASDARLTWNRIELELLRNEAEALLNQGQQ